MIFEQSDPFPHTHAHNPAQTRGDNYHIASASISYKISPPMKRQKPAMKRSQIQINCFENSLQPYGPSNRRNERLASFESEYKSTIFIDESFPKREWRRNGENLQ